MQTQTIHIWDAQQIARQYATNNLGLARFAEFRELDGPIISELNVLQKKRKNVNQKDIRALYLHVAEAIRDFAANGVEHDEYAQMNPTIREKFANVV